MGRRAAVALFAALAVLVAPGTAAALAHAQSNQVSAPDHVSVVNPRGTLAPVVHVGPSTSSGRERRPSHGVAVAAAPGRALSVAPAMAWAHLHLLVVSPSGDVLAASRSRAPPVV
jgi:hypothetical protein